MTYVVTEGCIRCKYMDCVEVCPAQCFYEGATMLVINPAECIDCGLCEPTCPEEAIVPDSYPEAARWLDINQQYSLVWPNIRVAKDPPADAEEFHERDNKFDEFFSPAPAPA